MVIEERNFNEVIMYLKRIKQSIKNKNNDLLILNGDEFSKVIDWLEDYYKKYANLPEIFRIICDCPFILENMSKAGELNKQMAINYSFGTITNSDYEKIRRVFGCEKNHKNK